MVTGNTDLNFLPMSNSLGEKPSFVGVVRHSSMPKYGSFPADFAIANILLQKPTIFSTIPWTDCVLGTFLSEKSPNLWQTL